MIERALLEAAEALRRAGEPFVIATVVAVTGSAYRRPGARMLIARDRWVAGSVSGGCLEGDVIRRGWWRTESGPVVVTYDSTVADDADEEALREGLGLGCNGIVDVLLERADQTRDPFAFITRCRRDQVRGALVTVFASDDPAVPVGARLAVDAAGTCEGDLGARTLALVAEAMRVIRSGATAVHVIGGVRVLVEAIVPAPRLVVAGVGHDAVPLVELAHGLGWDVSICAASARAELRTRFPRAELCVGAPEDLIAVVEAADRGVAVVMNHDYARDAACVEALLRSRAAYIGVLGPRRRTELMLRERGRRVHDARLHAPVGLELGAETPSEIALAIVAEIQATLAAAAATSLREQTGPIVDAMRDGAGSGLRAVAACEVP